MSTSRATGWLVAQNAAMIPVIASFPAYSWTDAIFQGALFLVFSSFIFMISLAALQQSQSRDAMRKINAELRATQSLLAESERVAERLRISRELHDLVGHHLTALSLNLEVASHLIDGKAREYVLKAQSLSKLLLSDVREVVSSLRESDAIELGAALRNLVEGVPSLQVHLDVPEPFGMNDPSRAQVVLRLTQEIITNTLKHARARQLWLSFKVDAGALELLARDDGIGSAIVNPGNGLSGMRERLAQFGGVLSVTSQPGKGFKLAAHLPLEAFA
jgi:signal transduction histidine kinase